MKNIPLLDFYKPENLHFKFFYRTIKVTTFFFVFCLAAENTNSQNAKVKISKNDVKIEEILDDIESQTNYLFIYSNKVNVERKVSVNADAKPVSDVLNGLFADSGVHYSMEGTHIILSEKEDSGSASANQQKTGIVSGIVSDENGEPIVGANIQVKGKETSTGTITDVNGKYRIKAPENSILLVSFVGYLSSQVSVGDKNIVNISLRENTQVLNEVVVVGYGTVKKSDVTGAVSSITSTQLEERSSTNAMQSLSGQVAGVQIQQTQGSPGYAPSIKIRGISTITAGTTPLYVIDGFPIEDADMGIINPQDIESIEVLKDASSAAIYGSRGANGVVLVTTKGGKAGKTKVDVNYEKGFQQLVRKVDMMNSQEFIQYYVDAHNNAWISKGGSASDPNSIRPTSYQIPEEFITDPESFATTEWQDVLFGKAPSDNVQLSVSGGNEKTSFMLSGGVISQKGIVDNSEYQRYSLRSNITHQILSNLKIGMNLSLANMKTKEYGTEGKAGAVSLAIQNDPIFPVYNENGNYGFRDPESEWYRFVPYSLQLWHPYALTREIDNLEKRFNVMTSAFAEYKFLDDFTFKTTLNASIDDKRYSSYQNEGQKWGYSAWQEAQGIYNTYYVYNWLFENILNYSKTINDHSINVLLGYSAQKNNYEESLITSKGFPNDMVHTLNAGTPVSASTTESDWSMISYISRLNYSYINEYLLTATLRRDGCSRFGDNNKWGYFPSTSIAWKASEEDFIKDISWISSLKIRASYGMTGNNLISNYGSIGLLNQTKYAWGSSVSQGLYDGSISNASLKWEKTGQFDFGFNIDLFSNRLYLEADYYNSKTKDMLLNVPVPVITGFDTQLTNIGEMRNRGLELLVTSKNLVNDFKWETSFNISMNRNEVLKLGPNDSPIYISNWGTTKTEVGQPVANYFGYVFDGVFNNQDEIDNYPHVSSTTPGDPIVRDVNGDKVINENDRDIIGNAQPDFTCGLTNTFRFKNFDLNIILQGSYGSEILNSETRYSGIYNGNRNGYKSVSNYWKSEDDPGDGIHFKPSISYSGLQSQFSSYWVEDGSYLRIANIRLGYTAPASLLNKTPLTSVRLYVNVDNLYVFSKYLGYDPENSVFTDALNSGNDYGAYPVPRTITLGIKIGI